MYRTFLLLAGCLRPSMPWPNDAIGSNSGSAWRGGGRSCGNEVEADATGEAEYVAASAANGSAGAGPFDEPVARLLGAAAPLAPGFVAFASAQLRPVCTSDDRSGPGAGGGGGAAAAAGCGAGVAGGDASGSEPERFDTGRFCAASSGLS